MTSQDQQLVDAFERLTLGLDNWNQRTHVAIAYLYLEEHGFDRALELLRQRIKAHNAHNGIEESPTSGYNETTTVALLKIVDTVRLAYADIFPVSSADEFCDAHPELMSKHVLRFFYTPDRRMHPDAKSTFVDPDLAPLPQVPDRA